MRTRNYRFGSHNFPWIIMAAEMEWRILMTWEFEGEGRKRKEISK